MGADTPKPVVGGLPGPRECKLQRCPCPAPGRAATDAPEDLLPHQQGRGGAPNCPWLLPTPWSQRPGSAAMDWAVIVALRRTWILPAPDSLEEHRDNQICSPVGWGLLPDPWSWRPRSIAEVWVTAVAPRKFPPQLGRGGAPTRSMECAAPATPPCCSQHDGGSRCHQFYFPALEIGDGVAGILRNQRD